jgi:glutathione peroxidase
MKKELLLLLPIILGIFNNETLRQIKHFKKKDEFDDVVFVNVDEKIIRLKEEIGKSTIMIVNTASKCGFTKHYDGLEELHLKYKDEGLLIIGVPSNDFGFQEPGTNQEIKDFCKLNYNITFFISKKKVIKGKDSTLFYKILKEKYEIVPKWNFHKILITKNRVIHDFSSMTNPTSEKITNIIESDIKKLIV